MNKNIYLISWYFPSFPGGAEKSIMQELKKYQKNGYNVFVICFDEYYSKGKFNIDGVSGINYGLKLQFPSILRFYGLLFNKRYIWNILNMYINSIKKSEVLTQTLIAPIVAEFCIKHSIKYTYYLRDELNLNEFHNYEKGFRKILKTLKTVIEFPAIRYYKVKNIIALKNAHKIISNSKFMHNLLKKKYGLDSEIIYPDICYSHLDKTAMKKENQVYITFIGGENAMKGYDIVLKIAKKMPDEKFLIVGPYHKKFKKGNILFIPYQKNVMEIYKVSKLILMPSRWNEAFGRIVLEANYLGIPVIASNRGGLPEANNNKELIISDLENIGEWIRKIRQSIK
ncbi:glycosyltransferase family 4 protein [Methanothermococcus okinawensis]|uniref:Glycosyl transferase group 1 n=1 Tax=Methanothermococcus okinawensis (strain DSM 14208 / JCM 11175 / IH1) TaxID=647113 RepID=F8AMK7_METOI|nr:glycosyltransferase family 4 protein [Methanothermococcus okinawensis]AEH06048.1 glycosyl transferase group 1 [Methanothermococcus okinawensis IH1]